MQVNRRNASMPMSNAFKQMKAVQAQYENQYQSFKIKDEELLLFTESCRDLYESGMPINQILRLMEQTTPNKDFAVVIRLMVADIENGKLLSEAMAGFPKAFGEDYRSLISAAEKSGNWTKRRDKTGESKEGILDMLISYIKRRSQARERVKSGLIYPAMIAGALIATLIAFSFYILPALRQLFEMIGMEKSSIGIFTRFIIWFGTVTEQYWWAFPIIITAIIVSLWVYFKSENGKAFWMHYQLKLKGIGPIFVKMNLGEVMWLMGTLFSAGMTPQEVITILIQATKNREIVEALEEAKESLFQGISFCDALKKAHWIFDGHAYMVVSSAQKNGRLGTVLQNYAVQLFEKVDQSIDRAVKMIEPIMIVVAGVVVGVIVIGFYSGLSAAISNLANK
ncbi:MAG: type II secretion system F family protein [Blastocatellia bacterium]|nr:type II secretion system F family protein [Blastocatellia bacterium]